MKEMVKMWEARHYKARLEAMATLKMSGCVPPLAMQDKAYKLHSQGRKLSQMVETQECFYFKIFNPFTCLGAPLI